MNIKEAYNKWALQYDISDNKTRDLEARALRETMKSIPFENVLEIGCGTGKNTSCFIEKANHITAVDLSDKMLEKAKQKINSAKVEFIQADITKNWIFGSKKYDLVTFSLVLEHILDLDHIFRNVAACLKTGGHVYVGELHPFKQYMGTKARFDEGGETHVVDCFNHNISDFFLAAKMHDLALTNISEYFDNVNQNEIPRILTLTFTRISDTHLR